MQERYADGVLRCAQEGRPLYRTAKQSGPARYKKKVTGKSDWFKARRKPGTAEKETAKPHHSNGEGRRKQGSGSYSPQGRDIKTRTCLFVEHTPRGELAGRIREVLHQNEHILGFRVKVVERAGTPLSRQFPLTNLFGGVQCGRQDCTTCTQGGGGDLPQCTKRNLLYENICTNCHPEAKEGKEVLAGTTKQPAIYVGETCRSLAERGKEHWAAYRAGKEDSHILKHQEVHHKGAGKPQFHLRAVKFYRTALGRQVGEAVRIRRRGEGNLLNSRAEFNRCQITRLNLPQAVITATTNPPALEDNCPEREEGREEDEPDDGTTGMELLLDRRDVRDVEEVTARRGRQVELQLPEKRKVKAGRQGSSKKVKLEGEDQGWGELPSTGTRPAQENLPARQVEGTARNLELPDRAVPAKKRTRQPSIRDYTKPTQPISKMESSRFEKEGNGEELPGKELNCQEGTARDCPDNTREGGEPEGSQGGRKKEPPLTPSIGEYSCHDSSELPSTAQRVTESRDTAELTVHATAAATIGCQTVCLPSVHATAAATIGSQAVCLPDVLTKLYSVQLALCYQPEARQPEAVSAPGSQRMLVQEKGGREGGEKQMWSDQPELCNLNLESKICETHNIGLTEFRQKSKKWMKGSNGLYRNVFRIQKTFKCSENTRIATRVLNVPTSGENKTKNFTEIKSSPVTGVKRGR